jgi:hypothetical protein
MFLHGTVAVGGDVPSVQTVNMKGGQRMQLRQRLIPLFILLAVVLLCGMNSLSPSIVHAHTTRAARRRSQ